MSSLSVCNIANPLPITMEMPSEAPQAKDANNKLLVLAILDETMIGTKFMPIMNHIILVCKRSKSLQGIYAHTQCSFRYVCH